MRAAHTKALYAVVVVVAVALGACKREPATTQSTATTSTTATAAVAITPVPGPAIPFVVEQPETGHPAFADFAWREFIALNWPAKLDGSGIPLRGQADGALAFGDQPTRPRVWETWKSDWEIVGTANPSTPPNPTKWPDWKVNGGVNICESSGVLAGPHVLMLTATPGQMIRGINQALTGPLIDQNVNYVRYEIRLNENEYETMRTKRWFLASEQPKPPSFPSFDASTPGKYGAIELKIAWRELAQGDSGAGFYVVPAKIVDPGPTPKCRDAKLALIGFHIAHKSTPHTQWVWSTFEHVNNVPAGTPQPGVKYSLNDGDPANQPPSQGWKWPGPGSFPQTRDPSKPLPPIGDPQRQKVQVGRPVLIPPPVVDANNRFRNAAPVKGTVWENYILVGNQWPTQPQNFKLPPQGKYPDDAGVPFPQIGVANTSMETYLQNLPVTDKKNSCMACHYSFGARKDFSFILASAWTAPSPAAARALRLEPRLSPELQSLRDDIRATMNRPPGNQ